VELRSIEFGKTFSSGEKSFDMDENGYWFTIERGKQRGIPVVSSFCVPRRQSDWLPTVRSSDRNPVDYDPASVIDHYLGIVELDLNKTRDQLSGGFFKSAHGKKARMFRDIPMGKNLIEKVGREFAEELFLPNPATFTGHCWRRSCGTNASDAGVNVTSLMSFLGWTTPKTAIGYVQKSRRTSLNVSTFLSNVQRENKDLDQILGLLKTLIPGKINSSEPEAVVKKSSETFKKSSETLKKSSESLKKASESVKKASGPGKKPSETVKKTSETVKSVDKKPIVLAPFDSRLASEFSAKVCAASGLQVDAEPFGEEVQSNEGGGGVSDDSDVTVSEVSGDLDVNVQVGQSSESSVGRGGGSPIGLESRISTILSNLQHHGDLHVHFHFGNK
jgi:hypothetical protein